MTPFDVLSWMTEAPMTGSPFASFTIPVMTLSDWLETTSEAFRIPPPLNKIPSPNKEVRHIVIKCVFLMTDGVSVNFNYLLVYGYYVLVSQK